MVANFRPCCPPEDVYLGFQESGFYPAGGCRMQPKSLPEAADARHSLLHLLSEEPLSSSHFANIGCSLPPNLWLLSDLRLLPALLG